MKLYTCSNCSSPLYFENKSCLKCENIVGFNAAKLSFVTLILSKEGTFIDMQDKSQTYRFCPNSVNRACNWLIPTHSTAEYCEACSLNRTIPNLSNNKNMENWKKIEVAKHRLIYSLLNLHLPVQAKEDDQDVLSKGIAFDFLADETWNQKIMTGQDQGVITLNIEEADDTKRAQNQANLGEKYRTLLGHLRHEKGHYYWDVLIKDSTLINGYRKLFGDETKDYDESLKTYYSTLLPANWSDSFISPYSTSHSWEDWAETWAHYLHLMDTLQTAYSFGIGIHTENANDQLKIKADITQDPYTIASFDTIMQLWLPLTFTLNSLNRSMGYADFYPFFISNTVKEKLQFIHKVCRQSQ